MIRAKTAETPWRLYATVLALGAAISLLSFGVARSETVSAPQSQAAAPSAPMPAWAQGFVCHAKSGGWCDLRDWRGFGQPQQAAAPEQ